MRWFHFSRGDVKEPYLKKFAIAVFALCLFEALCYFWVGWWAYSTFLSGGATFAEAFYPAEGAWTKGFLILAGGLLHWVAPRLRLPLAVAGVFGGFYGAYYLIKSPNLIYNWDILHGELIATINCSEAILIILAIVCAVELAIMMKGAK
jgi:hypothetical protein